MRVASLNLNKRAGNDSARFRLQAWLREHAIDVLLAQEPWKPADRPRVELEGYRAVGGDHRLFVWTVAGLRGVSQQPLAGFAQRVECEWLVLINTYLDAYEQRNRATQLVQLDEAIAAANGRPAAAIGDFNLAPRPIDGLNGEEPSAFNSDVDRAPFAALQIRHRLVDTTAAQALEYTIERDRQGTRSRFRCDLALLPDYLTSDVVVAYDHSPRIGQFAFTDHSALVLDVPVTGDRIPVEPETLFDELPETPPALIAPVRPHKTAMARSGPSPLARFVTGTLAARLGAKRLLDHGCGRGADLEHYRIHGLDADGWDPHPDFGHTTEPADDYDLVTQAYVLNVLPDPWQRIQALQHAAKHLRPGGHLLVATRSPAEIERFATDSAWTRHHDGYWSHPTKRTFQKGIATEEIIQLAARAGLTPEPDLDPPDLGPASSVAVLNKPA